MNFSNAKIDVIRNTPENSIIIDIGCKQGWWIQAFNSNCISPCIRIGIDPVDYGVSNQYNYYCNCAVSNVNEPEIREFYTFTEPGCNSLLSPSESLVEYSKKYDPESFPTLAESGVEKIEVVVRSLESILDELNIGDLNLYYVKSDCQGGDLNAILSLGKYLSRVSYIEMEVSLDNSDVFYVDQPQIDDVIAEMNKHGFSVIEKVKFPASPFPEGEVFFVNENLRNG